MFLSSEPEGIQKNIYKHSWRLDFLGTPRLLFLCFNLLCKIEEGKKTRDKGRRDWNSSPLWSDRVWLSGYSDKAPSALLQLRSQSDHCNQRMQQNAPKSNTWHNICPAHGSMTWCSWKSRNYLGWKRSLRSLSPSFNTALPSPPLSYFPKVKSNWSKQLGVWRRWQDWASSLEPLLMQGLRALSVSMKAPSMEELGWEHPLRIIVSVQNFYTDPWLVQLGKMTSLASRKAACKDFFKLFRKQKEDWKIITYFLSVTP